MATKAAAGAEPVEARDEQVEGMMLDTQSAAVKKLIARGKERGYVTVDEINAVLPSEQVSSEMIEDTMAMLSEAGITVSEAEEAEEGEGALVKPVTRGDGEE
ncbi:MAG: RNA polymerase sigma factor RpoD, partial [Acetobacteraceae bacterium]|nr:RNA polymerase sigma factor RpoD [Acetobacteraceae bacterium]